MAPSLTAVEAFFFFGGLLHAVDLIGRELAFFVALDGDGVFPDPAQNAVVHADVDAGVVAGVLRPIDDANLAVAVFFLGIDEEAEALFIGLDADKVRAQARASDTLRKAGIVPSPLAGLPISIKDLFDVAGEVTSAGSAALRNAAPAAADAPAIARLRAAGAVLMGRTNLTEFAYSGLGINPHYDTPRNPYDRATGRVPGGSTAGGAVSVTDDMAVIGLGTDTGGSTRIPAALCGIVGYKPSKQRIPTERVFPLSMSLDSIAPMGPSVACCGWCGPTGGCWLPGSRSPLWPRCWTASCWWC